MSATEYHLRFERGSSPELPSIIVAGDDATAIKIAARLKFNTKFELWVGLRLVKSIAAGKVIG